MSLRGNMNFLVATTSRTLFKTSAIKLENLFKSPKNDLRNVKWSKPLKIYITSIALWKWNRRDFWVTASSPPFWWNFLSLCPAVWHQFINREIIHAEHPACCALVSSWQVCGNGERKLPFSKKLLWFQFHVFLFFCFCVDESTVQSMRWTGGRLPLWCLYLWGMQGNILRRESIL